MCTQAEETATDEDVFGFPLMSLQNNQWYLQGFVQQDYVRPICVPRSEDDLAVYGQTLFITGFGENPDGTVAEIKKKIQTSLISNDECREKMKLIGNITPITPYQLCSEDHPNSTDTTCAGDDGGPVMSSKKLRWFIEGLSSTYTCGENEPQTHLKIYKYLKWIKLSIRD